MKDAIRETITTLANSLEHELYALSEEELYAQWYFKWDDNASLTWNIYQFNDILGLHKSRCRRWEEHHNGSCCVVERVRDKYLMPRIRDFERELAQRILNERQAEETQ